MRLRKRTTQNPEPLCDYIVSAISQDGIAVAALLKVDSVDNTSQFDSFFLARIRSVL